MNKSTTSQVSNRLYNNIGPYYRIDQVSYVLNKTNNEVQDMIANREILSVTTSDGLIIFPSAQFNGDEDYAALLKNILNVLLMYADGWTVLYWLFSPNCIGDRSANEILMEGTPEDRAYVYEIAKRDAAGWNC